MEPRLIGSNNGIRDFRFVNCVGLTPFYFEYRFTRSWAAASYAFVLSDPT